MAENSNKTQDEMIARAEEVVKKASIEFSSHLTERVTNLEKAIHQNDREKVVKIAYDLETEASTFGWPRVTRLCKWLRKVFTGNYDQKPEPEVVLHTLNALKLMVTEPDSPNEDRDTKLFKELYPELSKVISDF